MKNRDYIKEKKIDDVFITVAELGHCALCDMLGIREYCNKHDEMDCKETILNWMEEEHNILPIGTIVEYEEDSYLPKMRLGYYNGCAGNGNHWICSYKENIGKPGKGRVYDITKFKVVSID